MCALAGPVPWPGPPRAPARPRRPSRWACLGSVPPLSAPGRLRPRRRHPPASLSALDVGVLCSRPWPPALTCQSASHRLPRRAGTPSLLVSRKGTVLPAPPLGPAPCRGHLPPASHPDPQDTLVPFILSMFSGVSWGPGGLKCFSLAEFAGLYVLRVGARAVPPGGVQLSVQPDTCHLTASSLSGLRRCPGASCPSPGAGHFRGSPALRAQPGLGALGAWNVDTSRKREAARSHCYLPSRLHARRAAGTPDPEIRGHRRLQLGQPGGQGFH